MKMLAILGAAAMFVGAAAFLQNNCPWSGGECSTSAIASSVTADGCAQSCCPSQAVAAKTGDCSASSTCGGGGVAAKTSDGCCKADAAVAAKTSDGGTCASQAVASKTGDCSASSTCGGEVVAAKTSDGCCKADAAVAAKTSDGGSCASQAVAAKTGDCSATSTCGGGVVAAKTSDGCCGGDPVKAAAKGGCCGGCTGDAVAAKTDDAITCEATCDGEKQVVAAVKSPMMFMIVGQEFTQCPKSANELSQKSGEPIAYVVRGVKYDCPIQAGKLYARQLTSHLLDITTPQLVLDGECQVCPISAAKKSETCGAPLMVRVAGVDFACTKQAREATIAAIRAADAVAATMSVGEKECGGCATSAKAASEASGDPIVYAVGEAKVCCPIMAECLVAMKKIDAAVAAAQAVAAGGAAQGVASSN